MGKLTVKGLELTTVIGTNTWEQHIEQTVVLDLSLTVDMTQAAAADDIHHAVDYTQLVQVVRDYAQHNKHQLLETLAYRIRHLVIETFPHITALTLNLHKPGAIRQAKDIAIELTWPESIAKS